MKRESTKRRPCRRSDTRALAKARAEAVTLWSGQNIAIEDIGSRTTLSICVERKEAKNA